MFPARETGGIAFIGIQMQPQAVITPYPYNYMFKDKSARALYTYTHFIPICTAQLFGALWVAVQVTL
jgi:hypothetical protein